MEKSPIDNKTVANAVYAQNQVNPPSNVAQNAEAPDNAEKGIKIIMQLFSFMHRNIGRKLKRR